MRTLVIMFLTFFSAVFLVACNVSVTNNAKEATFSSNAPPVDPNLALQSAMALKVSPGKLLGTAGADRALSGTITATNKTFLMGADRALNLTISRTRVVLQ